jgi:hypothetical protein
MDARAALANDDRSSVDGLAIENLWSEALRR